jgi:hypothetical protein
MAGVRKGFDCRLFPADIPCEFDVWGDEEHSTISGGVHLDISGTH